MFTFTPVLTTETLLIVVFGILSIVGSVCLVWAILLAEYRKQNRGKEVSVLEPNKDKRKRKPKHD